MISAIVFDLGKVLVDFSFNPFIEFLSCRGCRVREPEEFIHHTELHAYECGKFDTPDFFARINALLSEPAHHHEIDHVWTNIFSPIPEMFQLLENARQHMPVYILSNTSARHLEYLKATFGLESRADGVMGSFEVGVMKPDPEIYLHAERQFNLIPSETLFIDDRHENVVGAENAGWKAIHHQETTSTIDIVMSYLYKTNSKSS